MALGLCISSYGTVPETIRANKAQLISAFSISKFTEKKVPSKICWFAKQNSLFRVIPEFFYSDHKFCSSSRSTSAMFCNC
jgi:hypothetical protein